MLADLSDEKGSPLRWEPIQSHKSWWKIVGHVTANIYDSPSGLRVSVIYMRKATDEEFAGKTGKIKYDENQKMKKLFVKAGLLGLSLFCILFFYNKWCYHYDLNNAFWRTALAVLEDTMWASGYFEEGFSSIKNGMTMVEVQQILGSPLRACEGFPPCNWWYSRQKTGVDSYDRRWIGFDANGRVTEIRREFFVD